MIAVVDYGLGNIQAIRNIYKQLNIPCVISSTPEVLSLAEKIILPGVGAFDDAMHRLEKSNLLDMLNKKVLEDKIPVMGICVGMQMMAKASDEGVRPGLGWIDARVKLFDEENLSHRPKLPHMGWNDVLIKKEDDVTCGVDLKRGFYFLHSYYFDCNDSEDVLLSANYGGEFSCAVKKGNIYGFQFHPEKSHSNGIALFKNFSEV